ncbi:hypothetical protein Pcinc_035682, partial [Petrolisthes cinctipes]
QGGHRIYRNNHNNKRSSQPSQSHPPTSIKDINNSDYDTKASTSPSQSRPPTSIQDIINNNDYYDTAQHDIITTTPPPPPPPRSRPTSIQDIINNSDYDTAQHLYQREKTHYTRPGSKERENPKWQWPVY